MPITKVKNVTFGYFRWPGAKSIDLTGQLGNHSPDNKRHEIERVRVREHNANEKKMIPSIASLFLSDDIQIGILVLIRKWWVSKVGFVIERSAVALTIVVADVGEGSGIVQGQIRFLSFSFRNESSRKIIRRSSTTTFALFLDDLLTSLCFVMCSV